MLPRRAGGVTSRGDTRDWLFKAIAQSQNIPKKFCLPEMVGSTVASTVDFAVRACSG